ncbi:zinc dependent phospholipase C family protein [Paenibacillus albus]|uniref:Hydrolase n=1 Tax=Paenibacillus albus TaxID=2495582 RepID=A0A3S9A5X2_9BACL|nr:zinc dependent phospholipase C family protein [Paenibacillus albus]AZN41124.1 hydrolase [Paenibacillus albus]
MGSRIMHAIIAIRIAESLSLEDRTLFLLGGIAPDAVTTKNESHFFQGDVHDFSRNVDYTGFLYKYHAHAANAYILGYFTHLVADDIWLKGFNLSWLRNRMEANKELYNQYHKEFRLLNGQLLEYYGLKDELGRLLVHRDDVLDLVEVKSKDVEAFIPYVVEDMNYPPEIIDEKLHIFTFDQIIGYIETSIEVALIKLKQAAVLYRLPL